MLKRVITATLRRQTPPAEEPSPPAAEPAAAPVPDARLAGLQARLAAQHQRRQDESAAVPLSQGILGLWQAFFAGFRDDERPFEAAEQLARAADLQARVDALGGAAPEPALALELLALLAELLPARLGELHARIDDLGETTRRQQRSGGAAELRASHLADEVARCRTLIAHEIERRRLPAALAQGDNLHDQLAALFERQAGSPGGGSLPSDPLIRELEKLCASADPAALAGLPHWIKGPAARIIEVIQERNRLRRILAHHGLLPP